MSVPAPGTLSPCEASLAGPRSRGPSPAMRSRSQHVSALGDSRGAPDCSAFPPRSSYKAGCAPVVSIPQSLSSLRAQAPVLIPDPLRSRRGGEGRAALARLSAKGGDAVLRWPLTSSCGCVRVCSVQTGSAA